MVGPFDKVSRIACVCVGVAFAACLIVWAHQAVVILLHHSVLRLDCGSGHHPIANPILTRRGTRQGASETLYHRDDVLLYIAYVMLIWAAPIPADRWYCSLWP